MPGVARAIALATVLFTATAATPVPAEWGWFRTVSTGADWWVTQGKGEVRIGTDRFEATLRDAEDREFVRLTLRGSVSAGLVRARVTVHSSDVPVFEVSGRLKRLCWKGVGGQETLILTNGVEVIGLVREIGPAAPCKPDGSQ